MEDFSHSFVTRASGVNNRRHEPWTSIGAVETTETMSSSVRDQFVTEDVSISDFQGETKSASRIYLSGASRFDLLWQDKSQCKAVLTR
jgi:hypothetical protein